MGLLPNQTKGHVCNWNHCHCNCTQCYYAKSQQKEGERKQDD